MEQGLASTSHWLFKHSPKFFCSHLVFNIFQELTRASFLQNGIELLITGHWLRSLCRFRRILCHTGILYNKQLLAFVADISQRFPRVRWFPGWLLSTVRKYRGHSRAFQLLNGKLFEDSWFKLVLCKMGLCSVDTLVYLSGSLTVNIKKQRNW